MDTVSIFCAIDDFCELFEPRWQQHLLAGTPKQRDRKPKLCLSEVLTIIVGFHLLGYRTFKGYYTQHVLPHQLHYFPRLVSYQRFVELMPGALLPLCVLLTTRFGQCSGISFIDSTKISVCRNRRIWSHKVFKALAKRGKTSVDWLSVFKLHLVVNDCGELLAVTITAGIGHDPNPVQQSARHAARRLFGDRAYITQNLSQQLLQP